MKTIKLIFNTGSNNEHYNGDCDFGVVKVTPELYQTIVNRIEVLQAASEKDHHVWKLEAFDYHCSYYNTDLSNELTNELETEVYTAGYAVLPDDAKLENYEEQRTEMEQMVLRYSGDTASVSWSCSPKHSDVEVETNPIFITDLKELMK